MRTWARIRVVAAMAAMAAGAQAAPNGWTAHPAPGAQIAVDTFPMAASVTPDGKYMLVMNAGKNPPSISVIDLAAGKETSRAAVADAWLGLAISKNGDKVYVGGGSRAAVFEFSLANGALTAGRTFPIVAERDRTAQDFAGDVRFAPDGHLLYVADVQRDTVVVMNPQSGLILSRIRTGRRPYRILFHPSGKTMYVSSWAEGAIGVYNVDSGERLANLRVAPHTTDMVWVDGGLPAGSAAPGEGLAEVKARIFVAAANTNSLYVLGVSESGELTKLETVNLAMTQRQPLGMTPSAVGLSADKQKVYVACSDVNAVAVVDITGPRTMAEGYVAAGAYPTGVVGLEDGRIAVLNGDSDSVQLTDAPDAETLNKYTDAVLAGSLYRDGSLDLEIPEGNPVRPAGPIQHVIYVVREAGAGKGATPNRDRLAQEFVALQGFTAAGNFAEGVSWATAGIAPDYTVRLARNVAAGRRRVYDFEGQEPTNLPPAGYLWNAAAQAGVKIRNYGFEAHNHEKPTAEGEQVDRLYDPSLAAVTDMEYRGADAAYPDTERAKEFAAEMKEFEQSGELPQLLLVRIGDDDHALGMLADAVTKSRFWSHTAMFVVDANSAEAGRTATALVISPLAKHGAAEAALYNQMSVLRTVETILGLRPMTTFDAAATPLFGVFAAPH